MYSMIYAVWKCVRCLWSWSITDLSRPDNVMWKPPPSPIFPNWFSSDWWLTRNILTRKSPLQPLANTPTSHFHSPHFSFLLSISPSPLYQCQPTGLPQPTCFHISWTSIHSSYVFLCKCSDPLHFAFLLSHPHLQFPTRFYSTIYLFISLLKRHTCMRTSLSFTTDCPHWHTTY